MSSIWQEQLDLIVPYFVRRYFEDEGDDIEFPSDLKKEIQKFASRFVDNWYSKIIGPSIIIQDRLATFTKCRGWRAVYSKCSVKDGQCIEWALRLKSNVSGSFYISIIRDDTELLNERKSFDSWGPIDNDKYVYLSSYGTSRLASNDEIKFPDRKFTKQGDTLVITLDENRKISMKINDKDYGFVPNFTLKAENYRLAVHLVGARCEIEFY